MALQPVRDITPALVPAAVFLLIGAWTLRRTWREVKEGIIHIEKALEIKKPAGNANKEQQT